MLHAGLRLASVWGRSAAAPPTDAFYNTAAHLSSSRSYVVFGFGDDESCAPLLTVNVICSILWTVASIIGFVGNKRIIHIIAWCSQRRGS